MRWTPLLGLLTLGCGTTELPSQYAPFILNPGNIQTNAKFDGSRRDWVGELSVEAGSVDGAFDVRADVPGSQVTFELRSMFGSYDGPPPSTGKATDTGKAAPAAENPNGVDLVALMDGKKGANVHVELDGVTNDISVAFADEDGLMYLSEVAGESQLTELLFGGNFVNPGEILGTAPAGETELTLYTVSLRTDDGLVEAYPGFPVKIKKNNLDFQFLLLANWERTFNLNQACPIDERLAYEMVRLDPARPFDEKAAAEGIERSDAQEIDGGGCVVIAGA